MKNKKYLIFLSYLFLILFIILGGSNIGCSIFKKDYFIPITERGYTNPNSLISPKELIKMKDIIIINCSKTKAAFIPGAVWFNMDKVIRKINDKEIYIPAKEKFEEVLGEAGISDWKTVVIYDSVSIVRAARLWWTMKVYGQSDVRLLDGGYISWINSGFDSVPASGNLLKTVYQAKEFNKYLCVDSNYIKNSIGKSEIVFLDVRSTKEYSAGHIPGAVNIEWINNLNKDKTFKTATQLKEVYESKNITPDKEIIIYCGSGSRASVTLFVLKELLGYSNVSDYNGSWIEYSSMNLPKEK